MVKVKICGITNWADARRCAEAGVDMLGFNFYRQSPRYIAPSAAKRIARRLPRRIATVGVFVNESEDRIREIARMVGLDYIQLHGEESPAAIARLRRTARVIKAIRVQRSFRVAHLDRFRNASAILLDGFDRKRHGGSGKTFDWRIARRATRARRIFLAGGLKAENVADALFTVKPYAIDVCSGVESKPGKKDPVRLDKLMRAVRVARRNSR